MRLKCIAWLLFCPAVTVLAADNSGVPMKEEDGTSFYTVEAVIGEYGVTKLLVDTGASETVLADWFVKEHNIPALEESGTGTDSGGASFNAYKVKVGSVALAAVYVNSPGAMYAVPTPPPFKELGIGGILSPQTFFKGKNLFLNFPGRLILAGEAATAAVAGRRLAEKARLAPCSKEMPEKYVVKARLNGLKSRLYIDTGGRSAAVTAEFAEKFKNTEGTVRERFGAGSSREVVRLKNVALILGKLASDIPVDIERNGVSCPAADGKLGNDFLKDYGLLINPNRTALYFYR